MGANFSLPKQFVNGEVLSHTDLNAQFNTILDNVAVASGIASLDGSTLVVQDPANATATKAAGKICKWGGSEAFQCSALSATTGAFSGQVTNTVADGTAPLVITSTTAVANLNASRAGSLLADASYRTASATPAANAIPVSESNSFLSRGFLTNSPAFSAHYIGSTVSVTGATYQKVILNTEAFDTNNNFDSTTNYRFTPTVEGIYFLRGSIWIECSTLTNYALVIYKNGSAYKRTQIFTSFTGGSVQIVETSTLAAANGTTDYFELYVSLNGTGLNYKQAQEVMDTSFQGMRIF